MKKIRPNAQDRAGAAKSINTIKYTTKAQKSHTRANRAQIREKSAQAQKHKDFRTYGQSTFAWIFNVAQCIFYDIPVWTSRIYKQSSILSANTYKHLQTAACTSANTHKRRPTIHPYIPSTSVNYIVGEFLEEFGEVQISIFRPAQTAATPVNRPFSGHFAPIQIQNFRALPVPSFKKRPKAFRTHSTPEPASAALKSALISNRTKPNI
jgi:hypothetical protein